MRAFRKYTLINEFKLRNMYAKGMTEREIAKSLNVSQTGVSRARQRLGIEAHIPKTTKSPREIYDESRARAMRWKKDNPKEVCKQFSEWQTAHRNERNAYERDRRKGD